MLLLSLISFSWGLEAKKEIPLAVDGIIDLKNWDFEKDGIVDLKGQWKFFYQQELKPEDLINNPAKIKEAETLAIPSSWVSDEYSRMSYGSLLLEIKNIDQKSGGFLRSEQFRIIVSVP